MTGNKTKRTILSQLVVREAPKTANTSILDRNDRDSPEPDSSSLFFLAPTDLQQKEMAPMRLRDAVS